MTGDESIIALDVGERRIGVAVSVGTMALPYDTIERTNVRADTERIVEIARSRGARLPLPQSSGAAKLRMDQPPSGLWCFEIMSTSAEISPALSRPGNSVAAQSRSVRS